MGLGCVCGGGLRSYRYRYAVSAIKLLIVKGPHLREGDGNLHFPSHPIPSSILPPPHTASWARPSGRSPFLFHSHFRFPSPLFSPLCFSLCSAFNRHNIRNAECFNTPALQPRALFFFFLPLFFFLPFLSRLPTRESGPRLKSSWRQSPYSASPFPLPPPPARDPRFHQTQTQKPRAFRNLSPPIPFSQFDSIA